MAEAKVRQMYLIDGTEVICQVTHYPTPEQVQEGGRPDVECLFPMKIDYTMAPLVVMRPLFYHGDRPRKRYIIDPTAVISINPEPDRKLVDMYLDTCIEYAKHGLKRAHDTVGCDDSALNEKFLELMNLEETYISDLAEHPDMKSFWEGFGKASEEDSDVTLDSGTADILMFPGIDDDTPPPDKMH